MRAVYIEWEDAVSSDKEFNANEMQGWSDIKYLKKQIGFIYEETEDSITLFSGIHQDDEYYDMFQGVIKIPKSLIRERSDLVITEMNKEEKDAESVVKEYVGNIKDGDKMNPINDMLWERNTEKDLADSLDHIKGDCECDFCEGNSTSTPMLELITNDTVTNDLGDK